MESSDFSSAAEKGVHPQKKGQSSGGDVEKNKEGIRSPVEDVSSMRDENEPLGRLGKTRNKANGLLGGLKEKFSGLLSKEPNRGSTTEKQENNKRWAYDYFKESLKREQLEIAKPVIEEAKKKRNQLLEARGLFLMSKTDFDIYFSSKEFKIRADLEQQNVGDCYAVAAIYAMSRSPYFEIICRSSIKRLLDGSWEVRIPLLSEDGKVIKITSEELLPQKNRRFLKRESGSIIPDFRRKLKPVKGKEGLQVLEAAFIKAKFGSVNRLAAEGGFGHEVLLRLGGDNFKCYKVHSDVWNDAKQKWECPGLSSVKELDMAHLDHYLENFDPEIHIATASTKWEGEVIGFYKVKGSMKFLVPGHVYSVCSVNSQKRTIRLANPWDTRTSIELTLDQFKESFSGLEAIRIDSARLLNNMENIAGKVM